MSELKEGDKVRRISITKVPEWYKKMTSKGTILRLGNKKALVHWKDGVLNRWHEIRVLEKID